MQSLANAKRGTNIRLRTRIALALMAFAIAPMLVVTVALSSQIKVFKQEQLDRLASMAVQVNDVVDRNLFERYGDVQAFGYNKVALDPANWDNRGDRNPLVNAMNQYMAAYGIYKLMLLVSPEGKVLAVNSKDAQGKPLATEALYQKSYRDAGWLKSALAGDFLKGRNGFTGTVVEQPTRHPDLAKLYNGDDYALIFAAPVADDSGKTIGVWVNFAGMALVEDIAEGAYQQFKARGIDGVDVTVVDPKLAVLIHYDNQKLDNTGK